ncbi:MAG: hypothetical protein ACOCX6_00150 [bacterium]
MTKSITDAVLEYQRCRILTIQILHTAGTILYEYLLKKTDLTDDERNDFFCYFYPKIPTLFDRFVYSGTPFEGYMLVSARWQLKSFVYRARRREARDSHLELSAWREECSPGYSLITPFATSGEAAAELQHVFGIDPQTGAIQKKGSGRKILYVTMRGAMYVTDTMLSRVSQTVGCDLEWLYNCTQKLKRRMEKRNIRLESLKQRRNGLYLKILDLHRSIELAVDPDLRADLCGRLFSLQRHLRNALTEISHSTTEPSHKDIAEVLGIPKGSVDSGMHGLKHRVKGYIDGGKRCA